MRLIRRFVPGFAKVAHPLYQLMKKGVAFEWDAACQTAFNKLKELLTTAPVLCYPQFGPDAQFILETDASSLGLGAILAQKQENGKYTLWPMPPVLLIHTRSTMASLKWKHWL